MKVLAWQVLAYKRGNVVGKITALTVEARDAAVIDFFDAGYDVAYHLETETI